MKIPAMAMACLAVFLYCGTDLAAQPLTADDVIGPLKADFEPAGNGCFAGTTAPALVKIEILIQKDGSASMASSSPALDPAADACLKAAIGNVKFRASGQAFKAVYSFIPNPQEAIPTIVIPAPSEAQPAPQPPVQVPAPAAEPVPPKKKAARPPPDPVLYRQFKISRGVMIGGFAAFGAFWISMLITSLFYAIDNLCIEPDSEDECPDTPGDHINAGAVAPLIGPYWSSQDLLDAGYRKEGIWYIVNPTLQIAFFAVALTGLGLMVTSFKKMHRTQSTYKVVFLPMTARSPGERSVVGGMLVGAF
jgi:hypothetical protein